MTVVGNISQTVWDVALQEYGGAEGIAWILQDNPDLVDGSGDLPTGRVTYKVRDGQRTAFEEKFSTGSQRRTNPPQYRSNSQQTVWDVALQHYGDAAGLAEILAENPSLVNADGSINQGLVVHNLNQNIINRPIWARMIDYVPSTGLIPDNRTITALTDDEGNVLVDDEGNVLVTISFD